MPQNPSRSSVHLDVSAAGEPSAAVVDPDAPFRILILGDFSGRANRRLHASLAGRRPVPVDMDNFDQAIEQMLPALKLPRATLQFRELDDFHPDHLYRAAGVFQELAGMKSPPRPAAKAAPAPAPSPPPESLVPGLLDSMIETTEARPPAASFEETGDLAAFINRIMAPYLEERPDPGQVEWAARMNAVAGELMRNILHHPDFQAIEAAWRAVWMLVQELTTDGEIKISVFDATLQELMDDRSGTEKLIAGRQDPWALIAANFDFGQSEEDAARLRAFGRMAGAIRAPFLAEAQPPSESMTQPHWQALRRSAAARSIGLVLPRFLMRLPYGKSTTPTEALAFEEMPESVHAHYLWANPAFACVHLIGQAFRSHGWEMRPGVYRRIDGLPLHVYQSEGETVNKPCAEVLLSERDADFLLEHGFMPLASLKNEDAVLLVRFQSIADPPAPLAGRWQ